jgi:hypothetical protein
MANKTNKNQSAGDEEEILIRDEKGEFKILKGGKIVPLKEEIKEEKKAKTPSVAPPPPPPKPKPVFDFYPEDEEEVRKIKKEMAGLGPVEIAKIDEIAGDLIKNFNLPIVDELLKSRFKKIIVSRLKDIRDSLETRDILQKKREEGGLGLNKDQADQIIKELNKLVGVIIKPATTRDIREARGARQPVRLSPMPALKIAPPPPALVGPQATKPIQPPSSPPLPQIKKIEESKKPQMVDVKFTPKLVGPVEEIERLNLVDFRRLSRDPKVAGQKIIDKISLLEEESFPKRIIGIKAWQTSEVYKIYLEIGEEGIKQGRPIRSIIQERQNQNKPTLTEAEFLAIMELNKNLKF